MKRENLGEISCEKKKYRKYMKNIEKKIISVCKKSATDQDKKKKKEI